jgi:hypothetical protein
LAISEARLRRGDRRCRLRKVGSSRSEKEEMKSKRELPRSWGKLFLLFIALSIVLIAPLIGFLSVVDGWVVFGKGQYLSQSQGPAYKVGLMDSFTLFVGPERQLERDILKALILAAVAIAALTFGVVLAWMKKGSALQPGRFFIFVFFVIGFLAADEVLRIQGTLGRNLRFLGDLPFKDHPIDSIVLYAGVTAALFMTRYRKTILASRGALGLMVIALAVFAAGAFNLTSGLPVEQVSGLLAPLCGIAALMVLGISQLRTALIELRPAVHTVPSFTLFYIEGDGSGVGGIVTPASVTAGESR